MALRESLTNVDLFSGLSPQVLDDIVARGTKMKRAPGSIVVEQGASDWDPS